MTSRVESSELVRYNANTRGSNVGDCTARAISLAFNIDYSKARKALNLSAKDNYGWDYNTHKNCIKVIKELGGGDLIETSRNEAISVDAFVDEHSTGTYIIWCSKDGTVRRNNHLACVIDGKVFDSWDSRTYYILGYWVVKNGIKGENITNIGEYLPTWYRNRFSLGDFSYYFDVFDDIINKNRKLKKLSDEYDIAIRLGFDVRSINLQHYTYKFSFAVGLEIGEWRISKTFQHSFAITFKPTLTQDELDSYFDKIFYQKLYSYIQNTVIAAISDICEGQSLLSTSSGQPDLPPQQAMRFWDKGEEKSFKTLPYWVRRLTHNFNISRYDRRWGGGDHIVLRIYTPPFDSEYSAGEKTRRFEASSMDILREELEYYKKTGDYEGAMELQYQY